MKVKRQARVGLGFLGMMLLIEFLDELIDGVDGAAWPLIRNDLKLSYFEIGLLLSVPRIVGGLLEPVMAILSDVWKRRMFVLVGGVGFVISLLLTGLAGGFWVLLASFVLFNPSSGAFVSLSQASMADAEPHRVEQNMARWALAGSLGNVAGPIVISLAAGLGFGWRPVYVGLAVLAAMTLFATWRTPEPPRVQPHEPEPGLIAGLRRALGALKRCEVWRWLALLEASDLMLDVFRGYVGLYFVDVVGSAESVSSLALAVFTGVGLLGDALLLPLLERGSGLRYLRFSVWLTLIVFPAFMLAPAGAKFVLLGVLGLLNSGWYSILKARLYASLPGQSGTVLAVSNLSGLVGSLMPFALGALAQRFGLEVAVWCLILGLLTLLVGLPRHQTSR